MPWHLSSFQMMKPGCCHPSGQGQRLRQIFFTDSGWLNEVEKQQLKGAKQRGLLFDYKVSVKNNTTSPTTSALTPIPPPSRPRSLQSPMVSSIPHLRSLLHVMWYLLTLVSSCGYSEYEVQGFTTSQYNRGCCCVNVCFLHCYFCVNITPGWTTWSCFALLLELTHMFLILTYFTQSSSTP
jgi:hypothetical protein